MPLAERGEKNEQNCAFLGFAPLREMKWVKKTRSLSIVEARFIEFS